MFARTPTCHLRPRNIKCTPPPLVRRSGEFRCRKCKFWWHSEFVWVTRTTHICYQGQACEACGQIEKPYHIAVRVTPARKFPTPRDVPRPHRERVLKYTQMNRGRG